MSAISQKSISGITSITSPAGTDDQISLHTSNTNEALKIDGAGNLHLNNHVNTTGVTTASNFKTGSSNLHSTGLTVGDSFVHSTGFNVGSNIKLGTTGIITATSFVGDGSDLTNLPAGLGTALSATASSPLNKMYYTNQVLGVPSSITVDVPASASKAYTQYADIKVDGSADLIVAEGDDLIPDVLGLADFGTFGGGASAGRIRVNSISNAANDGSPTVQKGLVVTGVCTATSFSGSGANLTSLPAQATIANNADNRVITGGSGVNLNGEANLTFDGTKLTVTSSSKDLLYLNSTHSSGLQVPFQASGTTFAYIGSAISLFSTGTSTDLGFRAESGKNFLFGIGGNEKLRITSAGLMGLGTNNPTAKLQVTSQTVNATTISTTNSKQLGLWIQATGGSNTTGHIENGIAFAEGYAGLYSIDAGSGAAEHLAFFTGAAAAVSERLRITSSGALGTNSTVRSANGGLDLCSQGASNYGTLTLGAGGGQNGQSRSSNQENQFRIMMPTYANPSLMTTVLYGTSGSAGHDLHYGGGTGWAYATNIHKFFTTANQTTGTGAERLRIGSAGEVSLRRGGISATPSLEIYGSGNASDGEADNLRFHNWGDSNGDYWDVGVNHGLDGSGNNMKPSNTLKAAAIRLNAKNGAVTLITSPASTSTQYEGLTQNQSGQVTMPNQPMCSFTVANTSSGNYMTHHDMRTNNGTHFNTSNNRFVCPVAGFYYASIMVMSNNSNTTMDLELHKNGSNASNILVPYSAATGGQYNQAVGSCIIQCAANDYLQFKLNSGSVYQGRHSNISFALLS